MVNFRCSGLLFLAAGCQRGALADSQVYIWQRVWSDQHKTALRQSQALFSTLRVLGIQFHPQEGVRLARLPGPASSAERGRQFRAATS